MMDVARGRRSIRFASTVVAAHGALRNTFLILGGFAIFSVRRKPADAIWNPPAASEPRLREAPLWITRSPRRRCHVRAFYLSNAPGVRRQTSKINNLWVR